MSTLTRELLRKLVHLFQVAIIGGYWFLLHAFSQRVAILGVTAILLILLEFEYFRVDYRTKIGSRFTRFFSKIILRKHEKNNVTSAVYFTTSTVIAFSAFDYSIALAALLMSVFGDLAAALAGTAWGSKKIFRNKSYIGTFAGLTANIIVGYFVLPNASELFIPMAVVASAVETVTQKLDDNLTVPLFAGFTGQAIVFIFKIATLGPL